MRKIVLITLMALSQHAFSQGSIDIDTNIQMGVAGTEHVKITTSNFSVHQNPTSPLIYGDFGTGNVGIGTDHPLHQLHIKEKLMVNWNDSNTASIVDSPTIYSSGQGASYPFSGRGNLILQPRAIDSNGRGDVVIMTGSTATPKLVVQAGGNVLIGTTTARSTGLTLEKVGTTQLNLWRNSNDANGPLLILGKTRGTSVYKNNAVLDNDVLGDIQFVGGDGSGAITPTIGAKILSTVQTNASNNDVRADLKFYTRSSTGLFLRLRIKQNGDVGIGASSPAYKLDVNGTIRGTTISESDRRWKKNLFKILDASSLIRAINPVSYTWRTAEFPGKNFDSRKHYGVIAQELEAVLPELVDTDNEGYKSVDYTSLIGLLVKAVQEKDEEIEELRVMNDELRGEMKSSIGDLQSQIDQLIKTQTKRHSRVSAAKPENLTETKP